MFKIVLKYHQKLLEEKMKVAREKSYFFLVVLNSSDILLKEKNTPLKPQIDAILKLEPPSKKEKPNKFLG